MINSLSSLWSYYSLQNCRKIVIYTLTSVTGLLQNMALDFSSLLLICCVPFEILDLFNAFDNTFTQVLSYTGILDLLINSSLFAIVIILACLADRLID